MSSGNKLQNALCILPLLLVAGCINGDGNTVNFSVGDIHPIKTSCIIGGCVVIWKIFTFIKARRSRNKKTI